MPEPTAHGPELRLLGGFALDRTMPVGVPWLPARRLLAYLALHGPSSRSTTAGSLWPEVPEVRAMGSLRTAVWRLGGVSPPVVSCGGERLALHPAVSVDVAMLLRQARLALQGAVIEPAGLCRGELLPGWCDSWVEPEREQLRQLSLHALEALSRRLVACGRYAAGLDAALRAVRLEPLRESAQRAVIAAHLAEDNVAEALRQYRSFSRLLQNELQVRPSDRLTALLADRVLTPGSPG